MYLLEILVERSMASTISFNAAMDACGKAAEGEVDGFIGKMMGKPLGWGTLNQPKNTPEYSDGPSDARC